VKHSEILNYISGVQIQMTPDRGRGVFASKDLKRGDLLMIENSLASVLLSESNIGI